jgi:hypothetical protein
MLHLIPEISCYIVALVCLIESFLSLFKDPDKSLLYAALAVILVNLH